MSTVSDNTLALETLLEHIRDNRGFDFTGYKRASLERRINKRMQAVQIETYQDYLDYLQVQPDEFTNLFNTILINVTRFFRDPDSWTYLAEHVLPSALGDVSSNQPIRVWNPGCASGQETCTIAILLAEALGVEVFRERVKIYGTDVDEEALAEARLSAYTSTELESVPEELRAKYFQETHSDGRFCLHADLRRRVIFGRHDLVRDAPISRSDLLVCRNTLMYLNAETQAKVLAGFHFALNDDGALFLGKGEMLLTHTSLFAPVEPKQRIFRRISKGEPRRRTPLVEEDRSRDVRPDSRPDGWLRDAAFDSNPVAQFVLDADNNLVMANSRARSQFGIRSTDLGRPFQDFQVSYEPTDLRSRIDEARALRRAIFREDVRWIVSNAETRYLQVEVIPLLDARDDIEGVTITITDTTHVKNLSLEIERSRQDLETAYEELESTIEEVETTNEEIQSTNEELETMNEELQSTNEELETMNEELQSTNEELEAVNTELRSRTIKLNEVNDFLELILTSLRVGVVVVNPDFQVQIWNGRSVDLWGLRQDEAVGGHFLNLDIGLPVEQLKGTIRDCLAGDAETQKVVLPATTRVGKRIDCQITCLPLSGGDSSVRGVIMLMEALAATQE
ncbi:MAG: PAS domain-containing protein [Chloroflexia bacterium]|nr:PAS domain-containing protein [Chloroflexia bacterium]